MGPMGCPGDTVRGPAGPNGPCGPKGAIGCQGPVGVIGDSACGPVGPAGPTGCAGPVGDAGPMGCKGPTLVGPPGPSGNSGPCGPTGPSGPIGAKGCTTPGVAGPAGCVGPSGPKGETGPTGPGGPAGIVSCWNLYREFWFDTKCGDVSSVDSNKVSEIAAYLKANPSLQIGIDASGVSDKNLGNDRANALRTAFINAGVPANRIKMGAFGDPKLRRDNRVEVLIKTVD